jgi:hypothetical protein
MVLSGLYHSLFSDIFNPIAHFKMIIKLIIVLIMAYTFPLFFSKITHVQLFKILIFVAQVHAILLILDVFFYSPIDWDSAGVMLNERSVDYHRPRGLFAEPSRYAIFQSILLATLLFLDNNFKRINLSQSNIVLILASILLTTSIFGTVLCIIFAFQCRSKLFGYSNNSIKTPDKRINFILRIVLLSGALFLIYVSSSGFEYIESRLLRVLSFEDGSTRTRIIGGILSIVNVIENSPLVGYGAGNWNQEHNMDSTIMSETFSTQAGVFGMTNVIYWSAIIIAGGILPAFLYIYLFVKILRRREYYYLIIMFTVTMAGGLYYDPSFWISLVIFYVFSRVVTSTKKFSGH